MEFIRRAGDDVNLVVYENIQPIVWIVTIPFFLLCLVSSAIRLYTRAFIRKPFGTDDWLMLAATVSSVHAPVARWNITNSVTDFIHWAAIYSLDVDHSRGWTVSKTQKLRETVSNSFKGTSPIPALNQKTSRRSALYVATSFAVQQRQYFPDPTHSLL
jgi:uncharacterized membrane protein YcjF (UPF0283 family)